MTEQERERLVEITTEAAEHIKQTFLKYDFDMRAEIARLGFIILQLEEDKAELESDRKRMLDTLRKIARRDITRIHGCSDAECMQDMARKLLAAVGEEIEP
jgi:hypothetical protein